MAPLVPFQRKLMLLGVSAVVLVPAGATHIAAQVTQRRSSADLDHALKTRVCEVVKAKRYIRSGDVPYDDCKVEDIESATGDDAKTILIDIGGEGASTDAIVVYRSDQSKIAPAKFRDLRGKVTVFPDFVEGASVMHADDVTLSAKQQTIFAIGYDLTEDMSVKAGTCNVHAYQWVRRQQMFVERAPRKNDKVRCDD